MKNFKETFKNLIASGATFAMMTASGCATMDEQSNTAEKTKIILSKDMDSMDDLSSFDRVCFRDALKEVRKNEAQKYYYDADKQKYAMKCFDACGGAFVQRDKKCTYMPSKYEFNQNACLCNGQNIIPHKEKEQAELELQACNKICESANTNTTKYVADWQKTHPFGECVCKIVEEINQIQH